MLVQRSAAALAATAIACGLTIAACRSDPGATPDDDDDDGGDSTAAATAGATTFMAPDACGSSEECETAGLCAAPYDPADSDGAGGPGPAACVDECIEEDDLTRWCLDDASCCGELRCNAVDGFCEPLRPPDGADSGTSGSGGSSSGSADGSSTASSTASTGDDGGSSSGIASGSSSGDASGSSSGDGSSSDTGAAASTGDSTASGAGSGGTATTGDLAASSTG